MTAGGGFDARPVRAFLPGPDLRVDESAWPASMPAMAQVLREGLELPAGLTVLVGENGSGKSTVMEALAEAFGPATWEDLSLVVAWRQFMNDPRSFFRHLFPAG
jgi:AAA domain